MARLPSEAARLTPEAAQARLEALGYADPAGALRHLEALTSGVSRRAAIQRTLLPVMLGWFADAASPDAGLLGFHQVSDALGNSPWYLRLLRDDTTVARRMAQVLAASRYATDLLLRQPEMVAILGEDAQLAPARPPPCGPRPSRPCGRHASPPDAVAAVRALRRRELLRTATADLLGLSTVEETGEALTAVTGAAVSAALQVAVRTAEAGQGRCPPGCAWWRWARFGGHETGYGSDADVMFVHDPVPGADEQEASRAAHAVAEDLRALLARQSARPAAADRPRAAARGQAGPAGAHPGLLPRVLRALVGPLGGPGAAAGRAGRPSDRPLGARFTALADEFRYPAGGIGGDFAREIRRIKARMEAERMPRGVDPALHLKLGPGGLSDVEWVVQLLQLRHAHAVPELRTTRTLAGLAAAAGAGLVRGGRRGRAGRRLAAGGPGQGRGGPGPGPPVRYAAHPPSRSGRGGLGLGYPPEAYRDLEQDYRRAARRARAVMERLFYGW